MKTWKYHKSIEWKDEGNEYKILTQLYDIGVYLIFYENDKYQQSSLTPKEVESGEKELMKTLKERGITPEFGELIEVQLIDGFYKKVKK